MSVALSFYSNLQSLNLSTRATSCCTIRHNPIQNPSNVNLIFSCPPFRIFPFFICCVSSVWRFLWTMFRFSSFGYFLHFCLACGSSLIFGLYLFVFISCCLSSLLIEFRLSSLSCPSSSISFARSPFWKILKLSTRQTRATCSFCL